MIDQKDRKNRIKGKDKIKGKRVQNRRKEVQKDRKERLEEQEGKIQKEGQNRRKRMIEQKKRKDRLEGKE